MGDLWLNEMNMIVLDAYTFRISADHPQVSLKDIFVEMFNSALESYDYEKLIWTNL